MTTDIAALIAEARARTVAHARQNAEGSIDLAHRLADALESLTASLSVSERSDATVTEVTAPATDDEREEIARIIRDADDKAYAESGWFAALPTGLADAILAAGFRRSARVPVSRDELRAWAGMQVTGALANTTANGFLGVGALDAIYEQYDIFPKADRKPADSGEGRA